MEFLIFLFFFQNHFTPHLPENEDTGDLSTCEILGTYIDAYGDINTENRCVNGQERDDGFSGKPGLCRFKNVLTYVHLFQGIGFRVWLEHALGLTEIKAENFARELLDNKIVCVGDGSAESSIFSNDRYYLMVRYIQVCATRQENKT